MTCIEHISTITFSKTCLNATKYDGIIINFVILH